MLKLRNIKAEEFKKRESVFVEIDGLLVPFFINEFKVTSSENVILKLDEITSETQARSFTGREVYADQGQIRRKRSSGEPADFSGYKVTDTNLGYIGIAGEITDISNNPLLNVEHNGKIFLVPLHEDIILEINEVEKQITINAPEGLFDL